MSATPTPESKSLRAKKVLVPKVWKRPHSTIYGKNVEFGSKLTSDKLGEINGRKFNSDLPWQVRNSGGLSSASTSSTGSQGYISSLFSAPESTLVGSVLGGSSSKFGCGGGVNSGYSNARCIVGVPSQIDCNSYADLLDLTNPSRYSKRRVASVARTGRYERPERDTPKQRIDFYAQYLDTFNRDVHQMGERSLLLHEPLLHRRSFDRHLDFNHEIGLFVPSQASSMSSIDSSSLHRNNCMPPELRSSQASATDDGRSLIYKRSLDVNRKYKPTTGDDAEAEVAAAERYAHSYKTTVPPNVDQYADHSMDRVINNKFTPVCTTTQHTSLLPKHDCQLASSPYGQSADGRKLSLGSINPHSYRPSLPSKSTTVHASDGEEFEFQDRSSPFYTDRWAGKTIRHFDSDLYSNANLFKSMIL